MSLIYIKGTPGTGKTSLVQKMLDLGYCAFDADDPRIGGPFNIEKRKFVYYPTVLSEEWYSHHNFYLKPSAIRKLKKDSELKDVFLFSTASNELNFVDMYDKILFLDLKLEELIKRIQNRDNNSYGKTKHELIQILNKYKKDRKLIIQCDVHLIDASKPIGDVVNQILACSLYE